MDIAKLVARLELQSAQFQSELEKTNKKLLGFQSQANRSLSSIEKQTKQFGKTMTGTLRAVNTAMSVLVGMGLKKAFQSIFSETAASSKEFADALADVKLAAKDLLSADDGAPAAAAAMRDLAETLKDPALQKAANDLTSTLIRGFAAVTEGAAHAIVGLQVLTGTTGDEVENLRVQIDQLDYQIANRRVAAKTDERVRKELEALQAQRAELSKRQLAVIEGPPTNGATFGFDTNLPGGLPGFQVDELDVSGELTKQMAEFQRLENIIPVDHLQEQMGAFVDSLQSGITEGITETAQRAGDAVQEVGDIIGDTLDKERASMVFVEEMQRDIFGTFSDLLANAGNGADEFGERMINAFKRIIADRATLELFNMLAGLGKSLTGSSGGQGFAGFVGAGLTSLFGGMKAEGGPLQQGKWYIAGEHGPEPVWGGGAGAFAMGYGGGGGMNVTVAPVFQNMRDVTDAKMAVYAKQISDVTIARIRDERRHGKF